MQTVRLCPGSHASIFQSVAAADDGLEVGDFLSCFPSLFFLCVEGAQCVGDQDACVGTESVVIEDEVLERNM